MPKKAPDLALERVGYVAGFKVKPRKVNSKNETSAPSTIVFSIETANDPLLIALLAKIQKDGSSINFGLEPVQAELEFAPDGS